jgi:hypothetical protein
VVRFTERARQALVRSDAAARRLNTAARVRIVADPAGGVRAELTDSLEEGERLVRVDDDVEVVVPLDLAGLIDAGDHDALTLATGA